MKSVGERIVKLEELRYKLEVQNIVVLALYLAIAKGDEGGSDQFTNNAINKLLTTISLIN